MAEKIKKSIPLFLILVLIGLTAGIGFNIGTLEVQADTASTTVSVGNAAPAFSVTPYEDPACHSGTGTAGATDNPVNVGSNVSIKAQATDANGDQWYLVICDSANPPTAVDVADCASGTTYGKSGLTNQGANTATAACSTAGLTNQSYAWHAYACDSSSGADKCSTVSQGGGGNSGTPFYVNHAASFTVVADAGDPVDPGATVTITTTAADAEDAGAGADDTLTLYVCKVAGATSSGCTGGADDEWCHDTSSPTTNPTCNWVMNVAKTHSVTTNQCEGSYNYYPYVFDNHGFAATGDQQGVVKTNTVSNVAPEVTAVSLNTGSDFLLSTEQSSDNIVVTGTIKDDNGCVDVDDNTTADVSIYYYKSGVKGYADCDAGGESNDNYCYAVQDCTYIAESCTGTADSDATFTCTVAIQYHANPTDGASTADSTWWDYTWRATLIGSDGALSDTMESTGIEMLSFMSYDLNTASIAYGGPLAPETASADKTTEVEATGNVGLDVNLYSTNANMCTDFPTCSGSTMVISSQHYDASDVVWGSMSGTLTTTVSDELELNCLKSTSGTPAVKNVHWKIQIPAGQTTGSYTGENTIAGKTGEATSW